MYNQKFTARFILFIYIVIAVSCSGNTKKSGKTEAKQEPSLMEVSIGGMSCTGCEQTIQNNIGKLEGVKSVKASFTTGMAIVEYFDGIVDTTSIRQAITGSGYTVKQFIAPAKQEDDK